MIVFKLTEEQAKIVAQESSYFLQLLVKKASENTETEKFSYKKIINEIIDFLDRKEKVGAIKHIRQTYSSTYLKEVFEGIYKFSSLSNKPCLKETKEFVEWVAASFNEPLV